ncbi:MAG: hypothetical protein ACR2HN_08805 [Tepidiformaceae bacterium]
MKILLLGNSDTAGQMIQGETWPELIRSGLERGTAARAALDEKRLAPYGPRAAAVVSEAAEASQPDIVILPLVTYAFAVGYVSLRVRQRFGERAYRWYLRAEGAMQRRTSGESRPARLANTWTQRLARKVIGVAPRATVEEVTETYLEIFRRLARLEDLQVLALSYPAFSEELQRLNPGMMTTTRRFESVLREAGAGHRFLWADGEAALEAAGATATGVASDGSHLSVLGHHLYAEMVLQLLGASSAVTATPRR